MAFVKKTWKDRIVQYANRRLLTKSGGEVEQVTVTRDEGTISEAGDQFNASNMNDLENRINNAINELTTKTNIRSLVTFNEVVTGTNTQVYVQGKVLYIFYQGESKAHSAGDSLFILPSGYRPSNLTYAVFLASNGINFITGDVSIEATTGECKVNQISNNSGAGRIYFTVAIPIG